VKYAAAALFLDVLINAANTLVFPLICAYLAAAIAQSALGDERLTGSVKLLKWACRTIMVALVTAFTLYLNLTGIVASSGDALASKAAKTALSAALPVVGSIISDAAGSIVSGAGMIRSAVGVFGLIAVLCVCLLPFLRLGVRYLVFKAAAALSSVIGGGRLSRLIDAVGDACGMILSLVGVEAIFIYISIISLVKAVSG
jgi:stage III sporulation protein AE